MENMNDGTIATLKKIYGKPLENRAEIERRFRNAVKKINVSDYAGLELRIKPPFDEKIELYYGDNIKTADNWDREIACRGLIYIPMGWYNKNRVAIRSDWAAWALSAPGGEDAVASLLEDIISGLNPIN